MKRFYILVIIIFIFSSCLHFDKVTFGSKLFIENLSDEVVYICLSCNSSLLISDSVAVFDKSNNKDIYEISRLEPNMTKAFKNVKISDDNPDKKLICPNKELTVFILLDTTISNYSWNEIVDKQMYKKKIIFSQADLDRLGFEFIYTK